MIPRIKTGFQPRLGFIVTKPDKNSMKFGYSARFNEIVVSLIKVNWILNCLN